MTQEPEENLPPTVYPNGDSARIMVNFPYTDIATVLAGERAQTQFDFLLTFIDRLSPQKRLSLYAFITQRKSQGHQCPRLDDLARFILGNNTPSNGEQS